MSDTEKPFPRKRMGPTGSRPMAPSPSFQTPASSPDADGETQAMSRFPKEEVVRAARQLDFSSLPRDETRVIGYPPRVAHDPARILERESARYTISEHMTVLEPARLALLTFPATYEVERFRGQSVTAFAFVQRALPGANTHPWWVDFKDSDGRWLSCFAMTEWLTFLE